MRIEYTVRHEYGNARRYPAGAPGEAITALTGRATLSDRDISALRALGHEVVENCTHSALDRMGA